MKKIITILMFMIILAGCSSNYDHREITYTKDEEDTTKIVDLDNFSFEIFDNIMVENDKTVTYYLDPSAKKEHSKVSVQVLSNNMEEVDIETLIERYEEAAYSHINEMYAGAYDISVGYIKSESIYSVVMSFKVKLDNGNIMRGITINSNTSDKVFAITAIDVIDSDNNLISGNIEAKELALLMASTLKIKTES